MRPMGIKRMNIEESGRYLIGDAIMRRILKSEQSPDALPTSLNWLSFDMVATPVMPPPCPFRPAP